MKQYHSKSFAAKYHEQSAAERKRNREILFDGQVFYNVMILAIARAWKDRPTRVMQEPDDFISAVCGEMDAIFTEPGDYAAMCYEETGITLEMR